MVNFFCTDCMEFMANVPDKTYDLAHVDPPYFKGVSNGSFYGADISTTGIKRKQSTGNHWDDNIPGVDYYNEIIRISKHQIIWGINYFDFKGLAPVGRIIWDKKNDTSTFSKAEIASISLIDSVQIFRWLWNGMLQQNMKNKWIANHPSPKPPELYRWVLQKFAKPGYKIIDTHGGSFSHAIAADIEGFDLDIIEIDKEHFKAGVNKFKEHKQQIPLYQSPKAGSAEQKTLKIFTDHD